MPGSETEHLAARSGTSNSPHFGLSHGRAPFSEELACELTLGRKLYEALSQVALAILGNISASMRKQHRYKPSEMSPVRVSRRSKVPQRRCRSEGHPASTDNRGGGYVVLLIEASFDHFLRGRCKHKLKQVLRDG